MEDEKVEGLTENEAEATPEQSEGEQAAPVEDPKYAGKSQAELVDILRNQEKLIGKFGNEIGEVRNLKAQLGGIQEYLSQMAAQRQAPPEPHRPEPEPDITNLNQWANDIISKREAKLKGEIASMWKQRDIQEAQANAEVGRSQFFTDKNKDLYEGIENDVMNLVYRSFDSGIVKKNDLLNSKTFETAAQILRLQRGEMDRLVPGKKGMGAIQMEKPGGNARREEEAIDLTDDERLTARAYGMTEKDAREAKKIAMEAARNGSSKYSGGVL